MNEEVRLESIYLCLLYMELRTLRVNFVTMQLLDHQSLAATGKVSGIKVTILTSHQQWNSHWVSYKQVQILFGKVLGLLCLLRGGLLATHKGGQVIH